MVVHVAHGTSNPYSPACYREFAEPCARQWCALGSAVSLSGHNDKGLSAVRCEGEEQRRGAPEVPFSPAVGTCHWACLEGTHSTLAELGALW